MWKSVAANAFSLLIVLCIAVAGAIGGGQREFTKEGPLEGPIFFEVPRGAGLSEVNNRGSISGTFLNSGNFFRFVEAERIHFFDQHFS